MRTNGMTRFSVAGILTFAVMLSVLNGYVLATEGGQPQKLCPIMGGEIDKSTYVDYAGKRVYFCCPGCKKPFLENPEKYIKEMESKGVHLDKAHQDKTGDSGK